ncbi:hypothetical protein K491DRAFT_66106 [Lophiostoma macrostomum CBS 122681]|uniref:USP domain-containing protein n=1 Tax=Lophiostoma macrostomum CBS 122681 TaxID=1314788 RepID=A0A6A6SZZ5_9PLEO|nr:hypothetical protein K491DRAFT_66106 [Lophiostoma macrostomum CBS 122681]
MRPQDHDLMESVTADAQAITVPASPPRRDSMEDADSSLTRKRPRLDNSAADNRAMATDAPSAPANHEHTPHHNLDPDGPPAEQQVEMTIRSQPPSSSQPSDAAADGSEAATTDPAAGDAAEPLMEAAEEPLVVEDEAPADSPPVIAIDDDDDDDDAEEVMGDYAADYIHIERDEEDYFRKFPFSHQYPDSYMGAIRQIISHFASATSLDGNVLPNISVWLDRMPARPPQWRRYFCDKSAFWDMFADFVTKVLARRYPFGEHFCDASQTEDDIFSNFFRSYVELCAHLLQIDAEILSRSTESDIHEQQLLCFKHIRNLSMLLRPGKNTLFHFLLKEYGVDTTTVSRHLTVQFLEAPTNGATHLYNFAHAACEKVAASAKFPLALWISQLSSHFGWLLCDPELPEDLVDRSQFHLDLLRFFRAYNTDLQSPAKAVDVGLSKDLIGDVANLLQDMCQWNDQLASQLAAELLDFGDPESPTPSSSDESTKNRLAVFRQPSTYLHALVGNAWKFKLLRKYVVRGRMELRVLSIGTMDAALVDIWREYNTADAGTSHPVMQYLAQFLLHERVINYIISVDSHPQIIQRSGNIVGFLVVTHRYSESQTDAIWQTVANSQDPRVVTATLAMLRNIIGLMEPPELLYLCRKLYELPIEGYTIDIVKFLSDVTSKLNNKYFDWSGADPTTRPWNVCVRIIQDTSPSRQSTKMMLPIHERACLELHNFAGSVGVEERRQIYKDCAVHIADRSDKATGSVRAIYTLCSNTSFTDGNFFKQNKDVTRQILEELCSFIGAENSRGLYEYYHNALNYRLEMLRFILQRAPDAIPADLHLDLWDHLVGKHALNNHVRDMAWSRICEGLRFQPENDFCKQLISSYVPMLEPEYFTGGLYDFVASYRFPVTRQLIPTDEGEKEILQIRGADLLWRIILYAPQGTIEDPATKMLASRYVAIDADQGVTLEEIEQTHIALVDKCTRELLAAYKILRSKIGHEPSSDQTGHDSMDVSLSETDRRQMVLQFGRTLNFQKFLLLLLRTKPEFCRTPRSDSKVEAMDQDVPFGDAVELSFILPSSSEKRTIFIETDNTLQDMETRICNMSGCTKVNLFFRGQRIPVATQGQEKLADHGFGSKAHILVQKAAGSEDSQPVPDRNVGSSVFETTVLNHFDDLFACMDSDDDISSMLFEFLSLFPIREQIIDEVAAGKASASGLFPPGKIFQAQYAACALQYKLREQLRRNTLDEEYLLHSVQLLSEALLSPTVMSETLDGRHELHTATVLVTILLEFLKERPRQELSSQYFSDEPLLVNRLTKILAASLKGPYDASSAVWSAYGTILEASLHSRGVWEAFVNRSDVLALHKALLLMEPRKQLREHIVQSIASVCGGDLPSTSPLSSSETAARFWAIISRVLPEAVRYPAQSEQLFDIAEQVFRTHDANDRDEQSLRSSLSCWSDLLLNYKHEEFVGRDEVDHVVLGFTKLLLSCILSLKSFKKPLNAAHLMEFIFRKYLFVPRIVDMEDENSTKDLPVLESNTRMQLYNLILTLAEDRTTYDTLLTLTGGLTCEEKNMASRSYAVDRSNEIRSSAGYVGLVNPRAICYMNSLLTQLFMNVNFRKFMLGLDVADPAASQRLLSETQRLFAIMQNTFRKSADPRDFAAWAKGLDGQSIDINIQMDADEFYNLLFDQWEGQMLSPEIKQQFRSFYGGQTVNQIKSKECEHVSERVESFFVVQCDVQGKVNLLESLQAFVEGDVMEGDNKYKCESCGGKFVDAVKRTCLKDVPDNLIFHLKRFDFDLVDMRRAKINDHFAFPNQIDVSLYSVDYLSDPSKPRQEDIFELVGVLVHQGTSENGHYYSYIRERPSPSRNTPTWVEFNDREVNFFDQGTIPFQTFGGPIDEYQRQQKNFSAYMLFYQRKSAIEADHREYINSPTCGSPKVSLPLALEHAINEDNEAFVREYSLHDPNHSRFIRQVLNTLRTVNHGTCSQDHQQERQAISIVLEHMCQTICRQRKLEYFEETITQLRKAVLSCSECCFIGLKWLASTTGALIGLLLRCPHREVRSQIRAFLIDSLRFLREKDQALYQGDNVDPDEPPLGGPADGALWDITQQLRSIADESWISSRGWDDFYLTLCQLSHMGNIETAALLNHGFLEFCLKILVMHVQPHFRTNEPDIWRIVERKKGVYNRLIEFVHTMLCQMDIRKPIAGSCAQAVDRWTSYDRMISKFPMTQCESAILHYWDENNKCIAVLDKMFELFDMSKTEVFYPGEVLKWMLQTQDGAVERRVYWTVREGVACLGPPLQDPYVRAAISFCEATPEWTQVGPVVDAIVKSATELREGGGEMHLQFFNALPFLKNEKAFDAKGLDYFYDLALLKSRQYVLPMLFHDEDAIRKGMMNHCDDIFRKIKTDEDLGPDQLKQKYLSVRRLLREMYRRIVHEHQNGSSRSFMNPLICTCQMLVEVLFVMTREEGMAAYRTGDEDGLIAEYQMHVEERLRHWAADDGTPISTGETYEHSDYGSESDEGPDLES